VDQIPADVRFALRTFTRRPLMTIVAVASLALGIGASSATFSVVDSVLLRPLPFEASERLVSLYPTLPELRSHPTLGGGSGTSVRTARTASSTTITSGSSMR